MRKREPTHSRAQSTHEDTDTSGYITTGEDRRHTRFLGRTTTHTQDLTDECVLRAFGCLGPARSWELCVSPFDQACPNQGTALVFIGRRATVSRAAPAVRSTGNRCKADGAARILIAGVPAYDEPPTKRVSECDTDRTVGFVPRGNPPTSTRANEFHER